jgi:hypothetical protein
MGKLIHSMGRGGTWLSALLALLLAAGCATSPTPTANEPDSPLLRLAPASLGRTLALQQQLTVAARGQTHRLDVILEADADSVRLAMMNLGQTVARLQWDGRELTETRVSWWPAAVKGERILSDLQLVLWPAQAISAALPGGWTLDAHAGERVLRREGTVVATVSYPSATRAELVNLRHGYRLSIDSHPLGGVT